MQGEKGEEREKPAMPIWPGGKAGFGVIRLMMHMLAVPNTQVVNHLLPHGRGKAFGDGTKSPALRILAAMVFSAS